MGDPYDRGMPVTVTRGWGEAGVINLPNDQGPIPASDCEQSTSIPYTIKGVFSRVDAQSAAYLNTPITIGVMTRRSITVSEEKSSVGIWRARVDYSTAVSNGLGQIQYRGSTRGQTTHITHSLGTVQSLSLTAAAQAPNHAKAIGVRSDGGIDGVDIQTAAMDFSVTKQFIAGTINGGQIDIWKNLSKTTNDAPWGPTPPGGTPHNFAIGSVLLEEVSFDLGSAACDSVTFNFSTQENLIVTLSPGKTIAKKGWEYLWISYQDVEDSTAKRKVKAPIAAYVEKVYREASFAILGI